MSITAKVERQHLKFWIHSKRGYTKRKSRCHTQNILDIYVELNFFSFIMETLTHTRTHIQR